MYCEHTEHTVHTLLYLYYVYVLSVCVCMCVCMPLVLHVINLELSLSLSYCMQIVNPTMLAFNMYATQQIDDPDESCIHMLNIQVQCFIACVRFTRVS